jgi:hypothetical protein
MEFEYNTPQEAEAVIFSLKHLLGTTLKHIKTGQEGVVKDILPFPIFDNRNSEQKIIGYNVRIFFLDKPFSVNSKDLEVAFTSS